MTGRPNILSADQKTIAFRAEREVADQLNEFAKESGVTGSEVLRACFPLLLKYMVDTFKRAKAEADRQDKNDQLLDVASINDVIKNCNRSTENKIRKAIMELIIAKRLEKAAKK